MGCRVAEVARLAWRPVGRIFRGFASCPGAWVWWGRSLDPVSPGSGFGAWRGVVGVLPVGCRVGVVARLSGVPKAVFRDFGRVLGPAFGGGGGGVGSEGFVFVGDAFEVGVRKVMKELRHDCTSSVVMCRCLNCEIVTISVFEHFL